MGRLSRVIDILALVTGCTTRIGLYRDDTGNFAVGDYVNIHLQKPEKPFFRRVVYVGRWGIKTRRVLNRLDLGVPPDYFD